MINKALLFSLLLLFFGCHYAHKEEKIVSIQMVNRNGFSETISNKERLQAYENVDFLTSQPYEKVLRVYTKDQGGKSPSKLTSYHDNGGIWQYLEALDGRAHGKYREWHENGKIKIEAYVIEGLADLREAAMASWLFDGESTVWDEMGNLVASFSYEKGKLIGNAKYFYPNGTLQKIIPYVQGKVDGILKMFDAEGKSLEEMEFKEGKKEGTARCFWLPQVLKSEEFYKGDLLVHGIYYDPQGNIEGEVMDGRGVKADFLGGNLYSLTGYKNGVPDGQVQIFSPKGGLITSYHIKDGKKNGEEWEFYPDEQGTPKLFVHWVDDQIQGMVKTWYPNGKLESQREMSRNKKQGLSFAYYQSGDLMLMEEYENDRLIKGSYFKKGETIPLSTIENGEGTAILHTPEGHFLRKISYEKGKPILEN